MGLHFQAHAKQQKHRAQVRQCAQQIIGREPSQHARADQHACQDFSHDARLPETLENLGHQLGGDEHQEQRERNSSRACIAEQQECCGKAHACGISQHCIVCVLILVSKLPAGEHPR